MKAKILVVDDSKTDRMIITGMLKGFDVISAEDGLEAMTQIEKNPDFDLIILDLNMPVMDGFQVLQELCSNDKYKGLRIIILTNFNETDNEIRGLRSGAVDYIRKPVNIESLKVRIDIHLQLRKIQQKIEQENATLDIIVAKKTAELLKINEKIEARELLFGTVFDQSPIGIAIGYDDRYILSGNDELPNINPAYERITGRSRDELASITWMDITHPEDLPAELDHVAKFKSGETETFAMEKRYIRPDGSTVWVNMIVTRLRIDNYRGYSHLCLIEDISHRKAMEKVLFESERSKSVLLSNIPGMAYRCCFDREWTLQFVSGGCLALTGYKPESLLYNRDLSFNDVIVQEYRERLWDGWVEMLAERKPIRFEYEIITATGLRKWVLEMGQGLYDAEGNVEALEGIIIDITDQKEREAQIRYINDHDYLTGLFNRRYFERFLSRELTCCDSENKAVLLLNLKRFDLLNLTFGYHFGEKVIRELVNCLQAYCSDNCQLYHISIERFAFYICDYANREELEAFCSKVLNTLTTTLSIKTIGVGIGVVEIDTYKCNAEKVLINASHAAENSDKNQAFGYSFFGNEMESKVMREADLSKELSTVALKLDDDSLYLEYQPIVDLKTGKINGFEALARYRSKKLGFVSPIEFIPIAEETQLIVPLGKRITHLAFGFLRKLELLGYNDITVSINVSAIQLLREDFLADLVSAIEEMKVDPTSLSIEITESVFSNNFKLINSKLEQIMQMGIKVAIDDFGTGYSSLSRERELNVCCIKIDKYFIDKLEYLKPEEAITGDIVSMAHKLGHHVVAEGVESEKQKQYLIDNHCDCMQGYLFSRPVSPEAAIELLEKTNPR